MTEMNFNSVDTPIEVQQPFNTNMPNPGNKVTYKTPLNTIICIGCPIGVCVAILFYTVFIFLIIRGESALWLGIGFITIWTIGILSFTGLNVVNTHVTIDPLLRIITVNRRKMICCLNKTEEYQFTNVKKVLIEKDGSVRYKENGVRYGSFKLEFLIQTNEVIDIFKGVMDKNFESRRCFEALRSALPRNIPIGGNIQMKF